MKIMFGTAFPPQFGGAERLLLELIRYVQSKGHEVVFCSTSGYQGPGIKGYKLPWARSPFPPKELVEQLSNAISGAPYREFARIVGIENPDRIFIQNEAQLFKFLPERFQKRTYVWGMEPPRLVFEPHTLTAIGRPHFHLYRLLMKPLLEPVWLSLSKAGKVAGCSDYSSSLLKDLFGLNAKTMYDWVDTEHFKPAAQVKKQHVPLILCATRINPIKRQLLICQALNLVKDLEWQAVFAGNVADQKYYSQVVSFCDKNGLSNRVKFPGPFGDGELIEAYTKAAFTVYTPVYEPFAFMPIEGMACGTPAIGVNEGGVREVIADGKVGLLARATPEDLGGKIRLLLEDDRLRNGMAASARKFVIDRFELKARCRDFLDDIEKMEPA